MDKCEKCLHSRLVVSENGYHAVCSLSAKKAKDCMMGTKSHFITPNKDENEDVKD